MPSNNTAARDVPPLVRPQTGDDPQPEAATHAAAAARPGRVSPFATARWVCVAPGRSAHARP